MLDAIPGGQEKKPRSNALMIAIAIIGFLLGMEFATIVISINFIHAEIEVHRADCDKRFNEVILPSINDLKNGQN